MQVNQTNPVSITFNLPQPQQQPHLLQPVAHQATPQTARPPEPSAKSNRQRGAKEERHGGEDTDHPADHPSTDPPTRGHKLDRQA